MCKVMEDLARDFEARGEKRALLQSIKNVIQRFNVSAEDAMDALRIAKADQPEYLAQL